MLAAEGYNYTFYPELADAPVEEQYASGGLMLYFGGTAYLSGAIVLPMLLAVGHFYSARPTYNEFIPTEDQICTMFLQLMPKGRAHSTHDLTIPKEKNPIRQFWCAIGTEWARVERMAVEMLDEAFCEYTSEDIDGWKGDYILPDEAAVYGENICAKVNRIGAIKIDEYRRIATTLGWVLNDIRFLKGDDTDFPGVFSTLYVQGSMADSPVVPEVSFLGVDFVLGSSQLGEVGVQQAIDQLTGLYDRLVPAHVALVVEMV